MSSGLHVTCDRCSQPLRQQGALVFGPPNMVPTCLKLHVCAECWPAVRGMIEAGPGIPADERFNGARP